MNIASRLLAWYDQNKRDLPWRRDTDPYRVWVSEVMLQQTRVEAVKPYFERWLERFPDVYSLAEAPEDEVLRCWQGLGYYSRARNLQQGVREVVAEYGGQIPADLQAIRTLAGVGEYTAGAILSIAYKQRQPAVDGNVLRVFSRLFCITGDIRRPATKRLITDYVENELPSDRPGDFNQAVMDLGSAICTPKQPRCDQCPLSGWCLAYKQGRQLELPERKKDAAPVVVLLAAAVVASDDGFLLRRRPAKGLLANMWEFPAVELSEQQEPREQLQQMMTELGQPVTAGEQPILQLVHTFSHRQWHVAFYRCADLPPHAAQTVSGAVWMPLAKWHEISFAGPHRKMAAILAADAGSQLDG